MVVTTFAVELLESEVPVVEASVVVVASLVDVGVVEESVVEESVLDELSEVDVDESDVEVGVDSAVGEDSEVVADSVSELDEDSVVVAAFELGATRSPISPNTLFWPAVTATRDKEYKKNEREAIRMMDES